MESERASTTTVAGGPDRPPHACEAADVLAAMGSEAPAEAPAAVTAPAN